MASIRCDHLIQNFGDFHALAGVTPDIRDREVVNVVRPSGGSISTLLRIIAGLEHATSGIRWIDDEDATNVPTRFRNIAMALQSYAMYSHMTCYENLALNLRLKGMPPAEIEQRVQETARTLEIEKLLHKRPRQLSGGQRQRVA